MATVEESKEKIVKIFKDIAALSDEEKNAFFQLLMLKVQQEADRAEKELDDTIKEAAKSMVDGSIN